MPTQYSKKTGESELSKDYSTNYVNHIQECKNNTS